MSEQRIRTAIDICDGYLATALNIAKGDYGKYIGEPSWARLRIEGDAAVLIWPEPYTSYDDAEIREERWEFPAHLLWATESEISQWRADEKTRRERESEEWSAKRLAEAEARDRATYEALKVKFGATP